MSIWQKYSTEQREEYKTFLQVYGALSNLFRQKKGDLIPYLDSKYQETIYSRAFNSKIIDIGNTPHDVLSVFGNERIGIGIKTWMNSTDSYQKVMQIKSYRSVIQEAMKSSDPQYLARVISEIKNERLAQDYHRLNLKGNSNVYHYVTRDKGKLLIQETAYVPVELDSIQLISSNDKSITWRDGLKEYRYSFADSQIWQKFSINNKDTTVLDEVSVDILSDPFNFLLNAYLNLERNVEKEKEDMVVVYLPMYSYRTKEVEGNSGLNAWHSKSKSKGSNVLRPDREIYIPIPMAFHREYPNFFTKDILSILDVRNALQKYNKEKSNKDKKAYPEIRFKIILPNDTVIPGLVTSDSLKQFQSGGYMNGKLYGQSDLGNWLLDEVLGLESREEVTREWLKIKGTDSLKLWRKVGDYENIYIDFAPVGSFEKFMRGENPEELNEEEFI